MDVRGRTTHRPRLGHRRARWANARRGRPGLRSAGCSPKQIARILGVRPAVIGPLIRSAAREEASARAQQVDPDVEGCWINAGWDESLIVEGHPEWPRGGGGRGCEGLASVTVARHHRSGRVSVCIFLVDTHCLGVKNTIGPRLMSRSELRRFMAAVYEPHGGHYVDAPLDLARQVVFGAVEFARGLGFEPYWELRHCAAHLGEWDGRCAVRFGRNGTPMYVSGPYDDPARILETLNRSVGPGGYHFLLGSDLSDLEDLEDLSLVE